VTPRRDIERNSSTLTTHAAERERERERGGGGRERGRDREKSLRYILEHSSLPFGKIGDIKFCYNST